MRSLALAAVSAVALALAACAPTEETGADETAAAAAAQPGSEAADATAAETETATRSLVAAAEPKMSAAAANLAEAEAYLAANGARQGVTTTASGLQYEVVEAGPADGAHPALGQWVCVHYRGTFLDGEEFDSSYSRGQPAAFPSDRLIAGWVEALQLMRPGDTWKLHIHPALAYGPSGRGEIPPNAALLFDIELIKLLDGPVEPGTDCSTL